MAERTGRCTAFGGTGLNRAECAEQNVGERPVHGSAHDHGKNEARRAIQSAGDDQQFVIERESHGAGGEAGIRVQQRNHGGHVRAADGHNQQHAECKREQRKRWETATCSRER